VARFDGRYQREFETEKAGVRIVAPMMAIETIAAGGGSICRFDGVRLVVGPQSAGADPGPACYGRGGPLTITDVNLLLGRIVAERFPFPLDLAVARARIDELSAKIKALTNRNYETHELAAGFVEIANANMAAAIRSISIAKGYDPRDYVLVAFGGAAAQHACGVARELGIKQILVHPDAGLLSAYGAGLADIERHRVCAVYARLTTAAVNRLDSEFERMAREARDELIGEGVEAEHIEIFRSLDLRYAGTEAYLSISGPTTGDYFAEFVDEHRRRYGYEHGDRPIEIVAARVEARGRSSHAISRSQKVSHCKHPSIDRPQIARSAMFAGKLYTTPIIDRSTLCPGDSFEGPVIVCEPTSTTVVEPGWKVEVYSGGELLLSSIEPAPSQAAGTPSQTIGQSSADRVLSSAAADPIQLEIYNNHFMAIATQMGITLRNTASSVNVKERLDFSCAIFDAKGGLVASAPHVPVHLGAMADSVRWTMADNPDLRPGDVFVTNDPYRGGSHLPDVTVITPIHDAASGRLILFTANRAHHAEIGGVTPGSMPPFARSLAEEGVLIRNFKLIERGRPKYDALRELLLAGPHPTRDVESNLADIAAQVAANRQGARDLEMLAHRVSLPMLEQYMDFIQQAAERKVRQALAKFPGGDYRFVDHLDDGSPIAVAISIDRDAVIVDFTGTGDVVSSNLNANRAIVTAAVMYVLRLLIDEDIPLNQGVLAPVQLVLPECLLNPPERERPEDCAAVAGGNVETSQRVVDVLLGALGVAAASQGTMNNLLFGDASFGYYETICGGAGATPSAPGADAVHTHMTNTRMTDPEVLERRYPVRLKQFAIRQGSGGAGDHPGGNGVIRQIEFLSRLDVAILSQRRGPFPPYGLERGSPGALGRNELGTQGATRGLRDRVQLQVDPGDILTIFSPGGGGWSPSDHK
jgi:5-oxoprolinase (ATP-hydrolysing)